MKTLKITLLDGNRSIIWEGPGENIDEQVASLKSLIVNLPLLEKAKASNQMQDSNDAAEQVLEHSWDWFSLHAGQRMSTVNFFLVASAFLCTAFVTAVNNNGHGVALIIALLTCVVSLVFYQLERRVRELIKAAEVAIAPAERSLAVRSAIPAAEIVERVEAPSPFVWTYSKSFRCLYGAVGCASVIGAFYCGLKVWDNVHPTKYYPTLVVFVGA